MNASGANVDAREVNKFDQLASRWWDPQSEFKPLHDINPLRLYYVDQRARLAGKRVADVGCGGGLLSEAMAQRGADVTGIDMAASSLTVAKLHAIEMGVKVDYVQTTVEHFAEERNASFDVVTCMEMLEHVPDPASVVRACSQLLAPGGHVFFSTINRNPKAYLHAIIGAEYVLRLLPKSTHDYAKFIRPSELEVWARAAGLRLVDMMGITYNPLTRAYALRRDVSVNYLVHAVKEG